MKIFNFIEKYIGNFSESSRSFLFGPKIYFIVGPTSSGKTSLSIKLAKEMMKDGKGVEIVSCDSRQVYKGFDLLSGKVTRNEMQNIPHHMIDVVSPGEKFSVSDYVEMALPIINNLFKQKKTVIVVGGTGFYMDALLFDYNLPMVTENTKLRMEMNGKTTEELFKIFSDLDPDYAKKIDTSEFKNNRHRMIRYIEIASELGYFPELIKRKRFGNVKIIEPKISSEKLSKNVETRLDERIEQGMIQELESAIKKYNLSYEYLESLGLEFYWTAQYLQKNIEIEEMKSSLLKDILAYTKRQKTWFKRYNPTYL